MADLVVGLSLLLILGFIVKKLFFRPNRGKGHAVCVGCSQGSCASCDPIELKERLKQELHKEY